MPQGPIMVRDIVANTNNSLNITAPAVIKAGPGVLGTFIANTLGSAGSWVFNDCASVAQAAAANQVAPVAYNAVTAGVPIKFDFPFKVGIVVSAVPTGGASSLSFY